MMRDACRYTPYYCEENIFHLCSHTDLQGHTVKVIVISNALRQLPMHHQRGTMGVVVWDYHVVLVSDGVQVYDLDSALNFPEAVGSYFALSFPDHDSDTYRPHFRIVSAAEFLEYFSSDRRHMIGPDGVFLAPPPAWPPIRPELGSNLEKYVDMTASGPGIVVTLKELLPALLGGTC